MSFGNIVQQGINAASNAQSYLNNNLAGIVSPKSSKGLCGWVFDIPKETVVKHEADVTDNYTESGSYINDHIVEKPMTITLSGMIGELVYTFPDPKSISGVMRSLSNGLTTVDAYLGKYTPQALQSTKKYVNKARSIVSSIDNKLGLIKNIASFFQGESYQETKKKKAYRELYAYFKGHNGERLLTVQTPFGYFENMVITNLSMTEGEDTEYIADISITLKQLRFADIQTRLFDGSTEIPRVDQQKSNTVDNASAATSINSNLYDIETSTGLQKYFGLPK